MHFSTRGFYTLEVAQAFIKELTIKTLPFIESQTPFSVLGDMTGYVPQDREVADAVRDQINVATEHGLQGVAIIGASSITKMQYARLAKRTRVEFFDDKVEALRWLRSARDSDGRAQGKAKA
ncbi:MAG: hypothetical protein QNI87_10055 [Erythrobacter sp.]|uniref:hypothetical protein n=1 Tax=Erythrobacter sp. TaxID=1042 RepID=UPI00260F4A8E|nr:hypothetical protein [Erythrobacter sp.]MDJ0978870.1 hypothetical protein [Erythrobacter sp.]